MFHFGKFVPGVSCMFSFLFFFFFLPFFSWCKVCLVSVKQGKFIYMPVLSTICVAVCAQESIPPNTKHCKDIFGMSKLFMDVPRMLLRRYVLAGMSIFFT